MKYHYTFHPSTTEAQRTALVLTLRKNGYSAYREQDELVTDATLCGIGLSYGTSTVIDL